jgi:hypothetical protein
MSLTSTASIAARRQADPVPVIAGACPDGLVRAIRTEVRRGLGWQDTADCVAAALRASLPDPAEILAAPLRRGDLAGYQSHLLHAEPDGSFSVSAMVWLPGQQTMIHDHVAWCVTGVLRGRVRGDLRAGRRRPRAQAHRPQREPGRSCERLRATWRHPPRPQHR